LQPCLQQLPERERSILLLTFYAERPAKEIAEQFAISEGNVRVIRHRGLARLRDCINREPRTV
jgi:RNA polymerase sigma-70 factor (ECF subfamily)